MGWSTLVYFGVVLYNDPPRLTFLTRFLGITSNYDLDFWLAFRAAPTPIHRRSQSSRISSWLTDHVLSLPLSLTA